MKTVTRPNEYKTANELTIEFYDAHAREFFDRTVVIDVTPAINRFLKYVPISGSILDAGCGSGRDIKTFLELGYDVTAFDASVEMVKLATEYTKHSIESLSFADMTFEDVFDGIWCCASLVHIPSTDLPRILNNFVRALRGGGIWFLSFMYGDWEDFRGERFFLHQTEDSLSAYLQKAGDLTILEWKVEKSYENGKSRDWLQCIVRKNT